MPAAQSTIGSYVVVLAAVVGVVLSFTGPSNAYLAAAGAGADPSPSDPDPGPRNYPL